MTFVFTVSFVRGSCSSINIDFGVKAGSLFYLALDPIKAGLSLWRQGAHGYIMT